MVENAHICIPDRNSGKASAAKLPCAHMPYTPALLAPHALPRLDEGGLSHKEEGHKKKRKPSK